MWELAAILSLFAGAAGITQLRHLRLRRWWEAVRACGLEIVESAGWTLRLTAREGPMMVTIGTCGDKGRFTRIVVAVPGTPDFHRVSIRREPLIRWTTEFEIGDGTFDATFFLQGPMRQALALLDADTRRLLLHANGLGHLELSSGKLRAEPLRDKQVPVLLPLLLDLGRRLAQPMDVPQRLADNARQDPEVGVRLRNLLFLARELRREPRTAEALRAACSDPSPQIRLRAAMELGAEGRGVLVELAEALADDGCSAQAVSHLGRELPFESMQTVLKNALRWRRVQTARACLEALGASGDAAAVDVLAKVLALERGELASAAALALGATGLPAAEPPLLLALQREEADVQVAAAQALGRTGSAAAVLPLQEAAERSSWGQDLRRAARQAVAEIQSRLQGASPGQLSLAGTDAGQLSLASSEAGQLSLTSPPEERGKPGAPPD